jgi:hypothetical protein
MAVFTLTGTTGGAAVLFGDVRPGDQLLQPGPLLVPAVLEGQIRQTLYNLRGEVVATPLLLGGVFQGFHSLLSAAVQVEGAWRLRWTSHTPVIGLADLEGDGSFVRLGDTDPNDQLPAVQFGRVISAVEMPGTLTTNLLLSGTVTGTPLLPQSFNFYDLGDSPFVSATPVLTGAFNLAGARRSPPFALFDGSNYLRRTSNDAVLNPSGAFTVSVTFDPELIEPGQDCVVVAKNNQTNTQAGWKVTYAVATGIVTLTVYGAADGTISIARPTSTGIRTRSRFTALVSAAGAITLYVNGSTNQGTQSNAGVWVAPNASTEPFSMACDEPSNSGTSRMKGAIYDFAFWSVELSGANAALLLPDGTIASGVDVTDLEVYWNSDNLQAAVSNGTFNGWTDDIASLSLTAGNPSGFRQIPCLVREAGITPELPPLLFTHVYDSLLADRASPRPDQTLTTTHRLSTDTRWRLWSQGSITPQIPDIFRQYRGDATLTVIFARVSGANTIVIAKFYGLRIEWQSTNSFFVISGDDNVSATNERYNYVVALPNGRVEPTENVVANAVVQVVTLRFNSFTKDLDIFFNGVRNTLSTKLTAQAAFERHTGLMFADFGDWRFASFIPACLSDAQVLQMLSAFQPVGYINRAQPGVEQYHPVQYPRVRTSVMFPFLDDQDSEPIPLATSATTVSGRLEYAQGGGPQPGSVTISVPRASGGTMHYTDNGVGAFVAQLGSQPVASSSISYLGVFATGSVSLTGQPADGDTVTLVSADGSWVVTFEFDTGSSITGGNFRVVVGVDATATTTNLRSAIALNPLLGITAGGSGTTVTLQHNVRRALVNSVITVSGANLTKSDFAGGTWPGTWAITITGPGDEFSTTLRGTSSYFWLSHGLNPVPELIPFDWIEVLLTQVYSNIPIAADHLFADAPYIIKDGFDEDENTGGGTAFIDPDPTIVTVTVNAAHVISAVANAGPTNAGPVITWWEVELVSGSTEVMATADFFLANSFSINRNHTDTFPIPPGQDWNEKRIRFVIQAIADGDQIWRSLFFRMLGEDFDNAPPEIIVVPGTPSTPDVSAEDLLTTEERERLVIARRARRPTNITPQREISRYKTTKVYEGDRGRELALMEVLPDLYTLGSEFRTYVVRSPDIGFLDRIAVLFYGAGHEWAWWAIAYANNMVDPDQEMFVGQRLTIPPRDALQRFLARAPVTTLST